MKEECVGSGSGNSTVDVRSRMDTPKDEYWRIGLLCKKDCYYITMEILKCLERNGYEWKLISSSYKIKCRKRTEEDQGNAGHQLNVLIQIFSVSYFT